MTSARKIIANRANAKASTGPRTRRGKARSAHNALRHGLNIALDTKLSAEVESLASKIANQTANSEITKLARRVAEAQIDLLRVREARCSLLNHYLSDPKYKPYMSSPAKLKERIRALNRLGLMMIRMTPQEISNPSFQKFGSGVIGEPPRGPKKFVYILTGLTKRLNAMDRYERRALSRRKFAIRELDALRANTLT